MISSERHTQPAGQSGTLCHLPRAAIARLLFAIAIVLPLTEPAVAQQHADNAASLVGTWLLASAERLSPNGGAEPVRGARGVLFVDSVGHVFEFTEVPARGEWADGLTERQRSMAQYGGFWGRYNVAGSNIEFEAAGGVSPDVRGIDFTRAFEFDGDRLVLVSGDEPQAQADLRITWAPVPALAGLSPAHSEVVGFWRHIDERRVNLTTGETEEIRLRDPSLIVYAPSGYLGVHFPALDREPFAAAMPSDDEAQTALRRYIGYFGALTVYPGNGDFPAEVAHNVLSGTSPSSGAILRRFATVDGDKVVLTIMSGVRETEDGPQQYATTVHMERLSGLEELLPR